MTLALPQLHHIGVAVKNVQKGIEYYYSNFNIGPFGIIESSNRRARARKTYELQDQAGIRADGIHFIGAE